MIYQCLLCPTTLSQLNTIVVSASPRTKASVCRKCYLKDGHGDFNILARINLALVNMPVFMDQPTD